MEICKNKGKNEDRNKKNNEFKELFLFVKDATKEVI